MSGQSALRERAELLEELRQIVQAMKNIAFAELQRVTHLLPAQSSACDAVISALQALPQNTEAFDVAGRSDAPVAWLVIGAERGFCGAFNDHLASEVATLRHADPTRRLFVAGQRLCQLLGVEPAQTVALPGCASLEDADSVLDEWIAALSQATRNCREVWLLYTGEGTIERRRLLPISPAHKELSSEPRKRAAATPLRYLPLPTLRAALEHQGLRLLLQGALFASLKQEHRWRLAQMQRAQDHLDDLGAVLRKRRAALRQTEITNEQETLMSSLPGATTAGLRSPDEAFAP
ncbi:MAG TPA: F0F1 ATP synthase subunit gamma [Burkholderiaceae bacterium]|nr:F0F1 ATP synthase subunit gamma [Burkholderiaceae bacterium]